MGRRIRVWHVTSVDDAGIPTICEHLVLEIIDGCRLCAPSCEPRGWIGRRIEVDRVAAQGTGDWLAVIARTDDIGSEHSAMVTMFEGALPTTAASAQEFLARRGLRTFFGGAPLRRRWHPALLLRVAGGLPSIDAWSVAERPRDASPPVDERRHQRDASRLDDEDFRRRLDEAFADLERKLRDALRERVRVSVVEDQMSADMRTLMQPSMVLLGLGDVSGWPDAVELKRAWRTTARRTHPDAGGTNESFSAARAAYERLARIVCADDVV